MKSASTEDASKRDELDAVIDLEREFEREGRQQGEHAGAQQGLQDGRLLGWQAGQRVCAELEFYHGAAAAVLALHAAYPRHVSHKAAALGETVVQRCRAAALGVVGNDATLDLDALLSETRALFTRMTSVLRLLHVRFNGVRAPQRDDLTF
ncbi:unnamed protein product [Agarophyton chilense]